MLRDTPLLCLVHIERCGGTTLQNVLQQNYPAYLSLPSFMRPHEPGNVFTPDELRVLLRFFPFVQAIGGHCTRTFLGYENVTPRRLRYVTFLREPIQRYLSHYNHQIHAMAQSWTRESFLAERRFDNFMTVRLAGREDLDEAKRRLAEDFDFVGLSSRFDESLVLLRSALGWPEMCINYTRSNVATNKGYGQERADDDFRAAVAERNQLDIALYQYAQELFEERIARASLDLLSEVARLEAGNRQFAFSRSRRALPKGLRYAYKPLDAWLRLKHHPGEQNDTLLRLRYRIRARLRGLES